MKQIALIAPIESYSLISDEDFELISGSKWILGSNGYAYKSGHRKRGSQCLMHRIIIGAKQGEEVHHINGDKLDNRRQNLELTTPQQHQTSHHSWMLAERNRKRRIYETNAKCIRCAVQFTKDPNHRGRQKCCGKRCAIMLAVEARKRTRISGNDLHQSGRSEES